MVWNFILTAGVGAIIGGFTNYLAIRMLFRPYKALYLGKWRVPFTPGLIPKRHDQISMQLGKVVEEYLVTEELLRGWLRSSHIRIEVEKSVKEALDHILLTPIRLINLIESLPVAIQYDLKKQFGLDDLAESIWIKSLSKWLKKHRDGSIADLIRLNSVQLERIYNFLAQQLIERLIFFLSSYQGKRLFLEIVEATLKPKNSMLAVVTNLFMNEERLVNMLLPKIIEYLGESKIKSSVVEQIEKLWVTLSQKNLSILWGDLDEVSVARKLMEAFQIQQGILRFLNKPIIEWSTPLYKAISPRISIISTWLLDRSVKQISRIYQSLRLSDLVTKQVKSFPLEKLEMMILDIATKELKAITYLGALLGGIIGVVQYFLVR